MRVSAAYSRLLQAELKSAIIKKNKLERENAALREDKKRLEAKIKELRAANKYYRAAIDAARKEAQ